MSKNIWIINEYAGTPYHGMEFRHYYLGKEFIKRGNKVTIISSSYSHLFKNFPKQRKENIDGVDYLWLRTFNYGTSHSKKRVLKWFLFMFKCFFLSFSLKKPDVIIVSPMAPFPILPAWVLSKIYGAKLIYEVKDIWPLSLIELGGFKETHPFIKLMGWFEKFALKKSNIIVSNLQNYGEHIKKDIGLDRDFTWISNGVDLDELSQIEPLHKDILEKIPKNKFIVGYTGTVGVANALDSFCKSALLLKDILFVIIGDGQEKQNLINDFNSQENILFINSIQKKQVQSMLKLFDVCYIGLQKEKLFKYGVSPNKLYDYMYSSKPIIYAIDSGKSNIVKTAKCGICVKAQNPESIANGVLELYNMKQIERDTLGVNGKKYVLDHFTYDKLAKEYEELF
ncbi:MAG: glycosyltransferase family 4 protein [Campylobacterota bacterium]|nr:glycosyltransferase family 4 protein [Campylobacterota bacterium]